MTGPQASAVQTSAEAPSWWLAARNASGDDPRGEPTDRADAHRDIERPPRVRDGRGPRAAAPRPSPSDAPGHRGAPPLTPGGARESSPGSARGPRSWPADGDRSECARRAPEVAARACVGVLPRAGAGPAAVGSPGIHEAAAGRVGAPAGRRLRRPGHASGELRLRRRSGRHKQSSIPELPPASNAATHRRVAVGRRGASRRCHAGTRPALHRRPELTGNTSLPLCRRSPCSCQPPAALRHSEGWA
jgi:hypothetical protein